MHQIVQNMESGETQILEAPAPSASRGTLLIKTTRSLISAGTERMLVNFGKASMIQKARQQPDKVKQVLGKVQTDGLLTTVEAVRSKLGQPLPLGYCNVGEILEAGSDTGEFTVGDRVVSNGPHADIVRVSKNLCAKIPDNVSDEAASFTVVASIGLQGIRLAQPTLGEAFVVTGAGLIGLLTVQLLRAHGCRVLAIDFDDSKLELARQFGAETCNPATGVDPVAVGMAFSRGRGVDGVIITASTKSNDPVTQAAQMCRKRGRIILVGVTGLELNRADFYEKELSFQVSCSYGPGRYDADYEEKGNDYPFAFVRWTEKRNFEAVLDMMSQGSLVTEPLVTARYEFENAPQAYADLTEDGSGLGLILMYNSDAASRLVKTVSLSPQTSAKHGEPVIGFIGGGNYAARVLIPAFKKANANLQTIVTSGGLSGTITGQGGGFAEASTDVQQLMTSETVNTIAIATRHDTHAPYVQQAIQNGKHVFVEKPLALTLEDLATVEAAYRKQVEQGPPSQLMVGFNRRFSPHAVKMKQLLDTVTEPKSFIMLMNAGAIPADHWTQDIHSGGGRIIGEACHLIDLMRFFAGYPIVSVSARRMGDAPGVAITEDKASITLGFADGSFGTLMYLANGHSSFPKERIEAFAAGRTIELDNFRKLTGNGWKGFSKTSSMRQDKGQEAAVTAFLDSVRTGVPAIPIEEIFEVARVTIEAAELLRKQ